MLYIVILTGLLLLVPRVLWKVYCSKHKLYDDRFYGLSILSIIITSMIMIISIIYITVTFLDIGEINRRLEKSSSNPDATSYILSLEREKELEIDSIKFLIATDLGLK